MPPRPPLAQTARMEWLYTYTPEVGGHQAVNVMYLSFGLGGTTASDLNTVAGDIRTIFSTNISDLLVTQIALTEITLTMIDGSDLQGSSIGSTPGTGGTTNTLPPNSAICVSWKIASAYRGGHPRLYLPGMSDGNLTTVGSNEFTTAYATQVAGSFNASLSQINALTIGSGSVSLGTVSYVRNKAERVPPVFYGYVMGATRCNTRVATQRRRLGKLSVGTYVT